MFSKTLVSAWVAALSASSLAAAQNNLACSLENATDSWSCPARPALATSISCDFQQGECEHFKPEEWSKIGYSEDGAQMSLEKKFQAPTLVSEKYIHFGRLQAKLRCAPGTGVVSSVVLLSDVGDEIDFEWIGSETSRVQSNYFGKGNTTAWNRGSFHAVETPASKFHTYGIEWTKDFIKWSIDGAVVRTLKYEEAVGGLNFPQTPSMVRLGVWAPVAKGSQEWAQGAADFSKGPFVATYDSVTVVDYAGGDKPAKGSVKEYVIGDKTASYKSVKAVSGDAESQSNVKASQAESGAKVGSAANMSAAASTFKSNATSSIKGSNSSTSVAAVPTALSNISAASRFIASGGALCILAGMAAAQL